MIHVPPQPFLAPQGIVVESLQEIARAIFLPNMTQTLPQATVEKVPLSPSRLSRSGSAKVMQESLVHGIRKSS